MLTLQAIQKRSAEAQDRKQRFQAWQSPTWEDVEYLLRECDQLQSQLAQLLQSQESTLDHNRSLIAELAQVTQERVKLTAQEIKVLTDYHYYEAEKNITRLGCRKGQRSHLERLKVIQDSAKKEQP